MSRVGKKPILIPEKVEIKIDGQTVAVKGPGGELSVTLNPLVQVSETEQDGGKAINVSVSDEGDKNERSQWGTARSLIANMIVGVTDGFSKTMEVNGVGFRVALSGQKLTLNVGFSHPVEFMLPEGVKGSVEGNVITISGADKQVVGATASKIRKIKKPEPYKGKGIKYSDEVVRRKAGKTAKGE